MRRSLKNFKVYMRRLRKFAKALDLNVEYNSKSDEGAYIPSRNTIRVSNAMADTEQVAVFLHELGHMLDDTLMRNNNSSRIWRSYTAVYSGNCSEEQLDVVLECEKRAWSIGRALGIRLGIHVGTWFDMIRRECLSDYRN